MLLKKSRLLIIVPIVLILAAIISFKLNALTSPKTTATTDTNTQAIFGWGVNSHGQLGADSYKNNQFLIRNDQMGAVTDLSSGLMHTIALNSDGEVWSWGANEFGQLGDGSDTEKQNIPVKVNLDKKIVKIAANQHHNLAIDEDGSVWAWGLNMSGQLGDGTRTNHATPTKVAGLSDAKEIAAGFRFSLAVKNDGSVWAWGGNCAPVQDPEEQNFLQNFSQILAETESYYDPIDSTITGQSESNNCLNEEYVNIRSLTPVQIPDLQNITQISAGFGHMMALEQSGDLWVWGCNTYGQNGFGTIGNAVANSVPRKLTQLSKVKKISAGYRHSMALTEDGALWAWGHNAQGEAGLGTTETISTPTKVPILAHVAELYAGYDYSLAVGEDGQLYGFGQNLYYQFAGNNEQSFTSPQKIQPMNDITILAVGGGHITGVKSPQK